MPHDVVDAHHHLWVRSRIPQDWIDPGTMAAIDADFTPADLPAAEHGVSATVVVQAASLWAETDELLAIAASQEGRAARIAGVVGWADLLDPAVGDRVSALRAGPGGEALVGLRTQVQAEPDPGYLDRADVRRAIAAACGTATAPTGRAIDPAPATGADLATVRATGAAQATGTVATGSRGAGTGLVFDLVVRHDQLAAAARLADALPDVSFALDHLGKPRLDGTGGDLADWKRDLTMLAARPNVTAKLSGLTTEARWDGWRPDDLRPAVEHALEAFGPRRLMFGSDWPVSLLASGYGEWLATLRDLLDGLSEDESAAVWAGTARRVYGLGDGPA